MCEKKIKMPRSCFFKCVGYKHLFKFPTKENILKIWKKELGFCASVVLLPSHRICDLHFWTEQIKFRRIEENAVPSKLCTVCYTNIYIYIYKISSGCVNVGKVKCISILVKISLFVWRNPYFYGKQIESYPIDGHI